MAGSMALVVTGDDLESRTVIATATRNQWHQINFSRFFTFPDHSQSSTCPSLAVPTRRPCGASNTGGTWISTSSPTASLHIINDRPSSDSILTVCFRDRILEEHYISKLHFSWPQVSCVSGYPARGSRTLFVSYQDSAFKIQKFALRFPTIYEAETFVNALNETLKDNGEPAPLNSDFRSEISSQSEFMSSNRLPTRAHEESSIMAPVDTYIPELPPSFNYEVEQASCTQDTKLSRNFADNSPSLPPSFASLLANCYSKVKPGVAAAQPTVPEEVDLKSQIVRYMEDSSFHDMLFKVDRFIEEMGGDLKL
ncbi:hypothetical protein Ddye_031359 [Dipteronia dyeriana]|uniref:Poor homologous synapsis 1 PH domain-containing protein n=1 Tax=Dipteronia dyeriana TaxID=168575 RepID=A0AAD9TIT4_9ROSI|nr:hypothetical protein Ddye_031359 [Dipteronia dyeriana]